MLFIWVFFIAGGQTVHNIRSGVDSFTARFGDFLTIDEWWYANKNDPHFQTTNLWELGHGSDTY